MTLPSVERVVGFFLLSLLLTLSPSSLSQVNGSLVSSMSHQEVVKLIKCEFLKKCDWSV